MRGWDETTLSTAFDPINRRGRNPVYETTPIRSKFAVRRNALDDPNGSPEPDGGAGSGNFRLTIPVLNLSGRGIDLSLNLYYNSRLWHKAGSGIYFDFDESWPAPGWSLGFGKLVRIGWSAQTLLLDGDGTPHPFKGSNIVLTDELWRFSGHTIDGTLIDYIADVRGQKRGIWSASADYPDGTLIDFKATDDGSSFGVLYATRLTDRNGNFISIAYRNNIGPQIDTITDTVGRTFTFHYDSGQRLVAVTGPGLDGSMRTFIRLHYRQLELDFAFAPDLDADQGVIGPLSVIDAIYHPGMETGYWFGDADSYSSYGMLAKVSQQRAMGSSASSLNEQGTITPGKVTRQRVYNYPPKPDKTLTDAPTYTTVTEIWEGMDTPPAVKSFLIRQHATPRQIEMTYPDGTRSVQLSYNTPGQLNDGLIYQTETYDPNNTLLEKTAITWDQGTNESPRVTRVEVSDERNQTKATEYEYGSSYNQITEIREIDYLGNVIRRRRTEYETIERHIFNLPKAIGVYEGSPPHAVSRMEFTYDRNPLVDTPNVVQHDRRFNPSASEHEPWTDHRGNVTLIKKFVDVNSGVAIFESRVYDITGNVISSVNPACCELTSFSYTSVTQFAYRTAQARGASNPTSPIRVTTSATYDLNTGLMLSSINADGRSTQIEYEAASLRPKSLKWATGAVTSYDYDDTALKTTETTRDAAGVIAKQVVKYFNGAGMIRRQEVFADAGFWDLTEVKFDAVGRLWQLSRPFRSNQNPQWSEISYDALGRVTKVRMPEGSEMLTYYNEANRPSAASTFPSQTTRVVDPWGRERWIRLDALGRLVEIIEPNPNSNGSVFDAGHIRTAYEYDVLDQVTLILQGPSPWQVRSFRYDALGRLTHQRLAERSATLNNAGVYGGPGATWSDVFTYDDHSNLISHIDARGVQTIYEYGNDPLNRLQSIRYDTSAFGDTQNPILPSPMVFYEYMTAGDIIRIFRVTTADQIMIPPPPPLSLEEYGYDSEGRLNSKTVTLRDIANFVINYSYDSLNRLLAIKYPPQYGAVASVHGVVRYEYDQASRIKAIGTGRVRLGSERGAILYASQINYNAAGQLTAMTVGPNDPHPITEQYDYEPTTGLLNAQKVLRDGTPLFDFSYDYLRTGTSSGRTGSLVRLIDNLDRQGDQTYQYDALGRLVNVLRGDPNEPAWIQYYSYDIYGNRIHVLATGKAGADPWSPRRPVPDLPSLPSGPSLPPELPANLRDGLRDLSYDSKTNHITTPGFTYDAAGNQTRVLHVDGSWQRYHYDAAGRLKVVSDDSVQILETHTYGANHQRLASETGQFSNRRIIYSIWSGNQVIAEYIVAGLVPVPIVPLWMKSCIYFGERLLATLTPTSTGEMIQYHHPDRLSIRLITNSIDTNVSRQSTYPFGVAPDSVTDGITNRRFTSYERSGTTGLDYAVNRYYDSQQGRFLQVDTLGMGAVRLADPQSLNMYTYVRNNPVNLTDPTGLVGASDTCIDMGDGMLRCTAADGSIYFIPPEILVTGTPPSGDIVTGASSSGWNLGSLDEGGRGGGEGKRGGGPAKAGASTISSTTSTEAECHMRGVAEGLILLHAPIDFGEIAIANLFAQIGATIAELSLGTLREIDVLTGGKVFRKTDLEHQTVWGLVQHGFNEVYAKTWEHLSGGHEKKSESKCGR